MFQDFGRRVAGDLIYRQQLRDFEAHLAAFVGVKYAVGLKDVGSLLLAVPAALATAYGVTYAAFRLVADSRASSVIRMDQIAGSPAEVTAPIPAGGVGEAVAMVAGQRYAASAREVDGGALPRGTAVTVVGMAGPTLLVKAGTSATLQQGDSRNA